MTLIERSALLPHAAEKIFDLVADIERYPEFLEGCVGAQILERTEHFVTATLRLSKGGLSYGFTTQNALRRPDRMDLQLIEGPFDAFSGRWLFIPLGEGACKASLRLQFELDSGLASVAIRRLFDSVALDLVDAVVRRAGQQLERAR